MISDNFNLLDFGIVGGDKVSIGELLHSSYTRGREDLKNEISSDFQKNLQSAAHSSSLLKSKLKDFDIDVKEMFIKIVDFEAFKCLVIINDEDYFNKAKRIKSYNTARNINNTNTRIELDFSIISYSSEIVTENIISDGFVFKYGKEEL